MACFKWAYERNSSCHTEFILSTQAHPTTFAQTIKAFKGRKVPLALCAGKGVQWAILTNLTVDKKPRVNLFHCRQMVFTPTLYSSAWMTFPSSWNSLNSTTRYTHLLQASEAFGLQEEERKGHQHEQAQVGEEGSEVPQTCRGRHGSGGSDRRPRLRSHHAKACICYTL